MIAHRSCGGGVVQRQSHSTFRKAIGFPKRENSLKRGSKESVCEDEDCCALLEETLAEQ